MESELKGELYSGQTTLPDEARRENIDFAIIVEFVRPALLKNAGLTGNEVYRPTTSIIEVNLAQLVLGSAKKLIWDLAKQNNGAGRDAFSRYKQ